LQENPFSAIVTDPILMAFWKLPLIFLEEQKKGPMFEEMEMQLLALQSLSLRKTKNGAENPLHRFTEFSLEIDIIPEY
jgi:hypothetical protein